MVIFFHMPTEVDALVALPCLADVLAVAFAGLVLLRRKSRREGYLVCRAHAKMPNACNPVRTSRWLADKYLLF